MNKFISKSEQDTINFAENFASQLHKKDIVVLSGDLGSGKTKFVQGILKHFGLENEISSPTFTIVNEYDANNQKIYHFDLYRLESMDEAFDIGVEDYFDSGAVCLLEWPERIEDILPEDTVKINIKVNDDDSRTLTLNFPEL